MPCEGICSLQIENYIVDPVSEELLKGEFIGKETIQVDCIEVADKKQLKFIGVVTAEPALFARAAFTPRGSRPRDQPSPMPTLASGR